MKLTKQLICATISQSILQILVKEEGNVSISFFHLEEFFDNLDSLIVIRVDELFGYPWYVTGMNEIKFTPGYEFYLNKDIQLNFLMIPKGNLLLCSIFMFSSSFCIILTILRASFTNMDCH